MATNRDVETAEHIAELRTSLATTSTQIDEIHEIVCGNGTPGLNERVRSLELWKRVAVWLLSTSTVIALGIVVSSYLGG
jgi:hypothetical protein